MDRTGGRADPFGIAVLVYAHPAAPAHTNERAYGAEFVLQETTSAAPVIAAGLRDEGSGIDIASLHLRINGRDVTGSAQVTAERILYTPMQALSAGEQTVELELSDRAGNKTMQAWHFTVK